jgi:hypothetical protein
MKPKLNHHIVIAATVAGVAAVPIAFLAGKAWASGVPSTAALTYSGTLEDAAGAPLQGTKSIALTFWDQATAGVAQCIVPASQLALDQGRFDVILPDQCTTAVKANPDLWIEVAVDGASLGRAKIGAVPYAVEAFHAASATTATSATSATTATNATTASTANAAGGALDTRIKALEAKVVTVTAWTAYTPTITQVSGAGSVPSNLIGVGQWRRVGDSVEVQIDTPTINCTGGLLRWTLPTGLTFDTNKLTGFNPVLGEGEVNDASNGYISGVVTGKQGGNLVGLEITGGGSGVTCSVGGQGGYLRLHFFAPIQGWTVGG